MGLFLTTSLGLSSSYIEGKWPSTLHCPQSSSGPEPPGPLSSYLCFSASFTGSSYPQTPLQLSIHADINTALQRAPPHVEPLEMVPTGKPWNSRTDSEARKTQKFIPVNHHFVAKTEDKLLGLEGWSAARVGSKRWQCPVLHFS